MRCYSVFCRETLNFSRRCATTCCNIWIYQWKRVHNCEVSLSLMLRSAASNEQLTSWNLFPGVYSFPKPADVGGGFNMFPMTGDCQVPTCCRRDCPLETWWPSRLCVSFGHWTRGSFLAAQRPVASHLQCWLSMPGETHWGAWRFLWQPRAAGGSFCRMQRSRTIHWRVELVPWMLVCALFCLHIIWLSHVSFAWSSFAALTAVLMHFSSMLKERFTGESRKNRIVAAWTALVGLVKMRAVSWRVSNEKTLVGLII